MNDKKLKRLRALLEKAESTKNSGNLEEAEAFMQRVQSDLHELNMTEEELFDRTNEEPETVEEKSDSFIYSQHEVRLLNIICKNNFCSYIRNGHKKKHIIIGKPSNIQVVMYLFEFILKFLREESVKRAISEYGEKPTPERLKYIRSYIDGCINGVGAKLEEQNEKAKAKSTKLTDIILYNDKAIEKYIKENHKIHTSSHKVSVGDGYLEGYLAGKNMKIYSGLNEDGKAKITKQIN